MRREMRLCCCLVFCESDTPVFVGDESHRQTVVRFSVCWSCVRVFFLAPRYFCLWIDIKHIYMRTLVFSVIFVACLTFTADGSNVCPGAT